MTKKLWTQAEVEQLLKDAADNDGHCSGCWRKIAIYKYTANAQFATILKRMAAATHDTGKTAIDVDTLGLAHSQRTQLTKMRFHGLVAKVKGDDNHQIARHWLVTHKGWDWLKGKPIERVVITFDNQVLGHEGGTVTILEAAGIIHKDKADAYEEQPITEAEARVYHDVRTPQKMITYQAKFVGRQHTTTAPVKTGEVYTIKLERLQMGKPVRVQVDAENMPDYTEYPDIAAFMKNWQVVQQ